MTFQNLQNIFQKRGLEMIQEKNMGFLKQGCPEPVPNSLQIRHLEMGICAFGQKRIMTATQTKKPIRTFQHFA
jgi:hypothetical protein